MSPEEADVPVWLVDGIAHSLLLAKTRHCRSCQQFCDNDAGTLHHYEQTRDIRELPLSCSSHLPIAAGRLLAASRRSGVAAVFLSLVNPRLLNRLKNFLIHRMAGLLLEAFKSFDHRAQARKTHRERLNIVIVLFKLFCDALNVQPMEGVVSHDSIATQTAQSP